MPGFEIFNKAIGYISGLGRNIKPLATNARRVATGMATRAMGPGRSLYGGLTYNAYRGVIGAGLGAGVGAAMGSRRDAYGERHIGRGALMGGMLGLGAGFGYRGGSSSSGARLLGPAPVAPAARSASGAVYAGASSMGGRMLTDGIPWKGPGRYNAGLAETVRQRIIDASSSARLIR